jgi:hypothetical protein
VLDQGADPNEKLVLHHGHKYKYTIHLPQENRDDTLEILNEAATLGDIELFDHLVERGAGPSRSIALHRATLCKYPALTTRMITHLVGKYQFDVNADDLCGGLRWFQESGVTNPDSGSPLACAVRCQNAAAVEALLKYGADVDNIWGFPRGRAPELLNNSKGSVIRQAVIVGSIPVLKLLLQAGADPSAAYAEAARLNRRKVDRREALQLCLDYGAQPRCGGEESNNEEMYNTQITADQIHLMAKGSPGPKSLAGLKLSEDM